MPTWTELGELAKQNNLSPGVVLELANKGMTKEQIAEYLTRPAPPPKSPGVMDYIIGLPKGVVTGAIASVPETIQGLASLVGWQKAEDWAKRAIQKLAPAENAPETEQLGYGLGSILGLVAQLALTPGSAVPTALRGVGAVAKALPVIKTVAPAITKTGEIVERMPVIVRPGLLQAREIGLIHSYQPEGEKDLAQAIIPGYLAGSILNIPAGRMLSKSILGSIGEALPSSARYAIPILTEAGTFPLYGEASRQLWGLGGVELPAPETKDIVLQALTGGLFGGTLGARDVHMYNKALQGKREATTKAIKSLSERMAEPENLAEIKQPPIEESYTNLFGNIKTFEEAKRENLYKDVLDTVLSNPETAERLVTDKDFQSKLGDLFTAHKEGKINDKELIDKASELITGTQGILVEEPDYLDYTRRLFTAKPVSPQEIMRDLFMKGQVEPTRKGTPLTQEKAPTPPVEEKTTSNFGNLDSYLNTKVNRGNITEEQKIKLIDILKNYDLENLSSQDITKLKNWIGRNLGKIKEDESILVQKLDSVFGKQKEETSPSEQRAGEINLEDLTGNKEAPPVEETPPETPPEVLLPEQKTVTPEPTELVNTIADFKTPFDFINNADTLSKVSETLANSGQSVKSINKITDLVNKYRELEPETARGNKEAQLKQKELWKKIEKQIPKVKKDIENLSETKEAKAGEIDIESLGKKKEEAGTGEINFESEPSTEKAPPKEEVKETTPPKVSYDINRLRNTGELVKKEKPEPTKKGEISFEEEPIEPETINISDPKEVSNTITDTYGSQVLDLNNPRVTGTSAKVSSASISETFTNYPYTFTKVKDVIDNYLFTNKNYTEGEEWAGGRKTPYLGEGVTVVNTKKKLRTSVLSKVFPAEVANRLVNSLNKEEGKYSAEEKEFVRLINADVDSFLKLAEELSLYEKGIFSYDELSGYGKAVVDDLGNKPYSKLLNIITTITMKALQPGELLAVSLGEGIMPRASGKTSSDVGMLSEHIVENTAENINKIIESKINEFDSKLNKNILTSQEALELQKQQSELKAISKKLNSDAFQSKIIVGLNKVFNQYINSKIEGKPLVKKGENEADWFNQSVRKVFSDVGIREDVIPDFRDSYKSFKVSLDEIASRTVKVSRGKKISTLEEVSEGDRIARDTLTKTYNQHPLNLIFTSLSSINTDVDRVIKQVSSNKELFKSLSLNALNTARISRSEVLKTISKYGVTEEQVDAVLERTVRGTSLDEITNLINTITNSVDEANRPFVRTRLFNDIVFPYRDSFMKAYNDVLFNTSMEYVSKNALDTYKSLFREDPTSFSFYVNKILPIEMALKTVSEGKDRTYYDDFMRRINKFKDLDYNSFSEILGEWQRSGKDVSRLQIVDSGYRNYLDKFNDPTKMFNSLVHVIKGNNYTLISIPREVAYSLFGSVKTVEEYNKLARRLNEKNLANEFLNLYKEEFEAFKNNPFNKELSEEELKEKFLYKSTLAKEFERFKKVIGDLENRVVLVSESPKVGEDFIDALIRTMNSIEGKRGLIKEVIKDFRESLLGHLVDRGLLSKDMIPYIDLSETYFKSAPEFIKGYEDKLITPENIRFPGAKNEFGDITSRISALKGEIQKLGQAGLAGKRPMDTLLNYFMLKSDNPVDGLLRNIVTGSIETGTRIKTTEWEGRQEVSPEVEEQFRAEERAIDWLVTDVLEAQALYAGSELDIDYRDAKLLNYKNNADITFTDPEKFIDFSTNLIAKAIGKDVALLIGQDGSYDVNGLRALLGSNFIGFASKLGNERFIGVVLGHGTKEDYTTLGHEIYHMIEPVLSERERSLLYSTYRDAEGIAEAFGKYVYKQTLPPSTIRRIFDWIKNAIIKIGNVFRGLGWNSPDDIFGDVLAGKYARGEIKAEDIPVYQMNYIKDKLSVNPALNSDIEVVFRNKAEEIQERITNFFTSFSEYQQFAKRYGSGGILGAINRVINKYLTVPVFNKELHPFFTAYKNANEEVMRRLGDKMREVLEAVSPIYKAEKSGIKDFFTKDLVYTLTEDEFKFTRQSLKDHIVRLADEKGIKLDDVDATNLTEAVLKTKEYFDKELVMRYETSFLNFLTSATTALDRMLRLNRISAEDFNKINESLTNISEILKNSVFTHGDINDRDRRIELRKQARKLIDTEFAKIAEVLGITGEEEVKGTKASYYKFLQSLLGKNIDNAIDNINAKEEEFYFPFVRKGGYFEAEVFYKYQDEDEKGNKYDKVAPIFYKDTDKNKFRTFQERELFNISKEIEQSLSGQKYIIIDTSQWHASNKSKGDFVKEQLLKSGADYAVLIGNKAPRTEDAISKLSPAEAMDFVNSIMLRTEFEEKDFNRVMQLLTDAVTAVYAEDSYGIARSLQRYRLPKAVSEQFNRKYIEGFIKDFQEVLPQHFSRMIGYFTNRFYNVSLNQLFKDPKVKQYFAENPDAKDLVLKYNDMLTAQHTPLASFMYKVRALTAVTYLGGRLSTAFLNTLNIPLFFAPEYATINKILMTKDLNSALKELEARYHPSNYEKVPLTRLDFSEMSRSFDAINDVSKALTEDLTAYLKKGWIDRSLSNFDIEKAKADGASGKDLFILQTLKFLSDRGTIESGFYQMLREEGLNLFGRTARKGIDVLMLPFRYTESYSRVASAIALAKKLYDVGVKKGHPQENIMGIIGGVLDKTFFDYTRANRLFWTNPSTSFGAVATLGTTLKGFSFNILSRIAEQIGNKDFANLATSMIVFSIFGGLAGLPFLDDLADLFERVGIATGAFKTPIRMKIYNTLKDNLDKSVADFIIKGVPYAIGLMDFSTAVKTEIPFLPKNLSIDGLADALFGVYSGLGERIGKGLKLMQDREYIAGLSYMLPLGLGMPLQAYSLTQYGATTKYGRPIIQAETGEEFKLTPFEAVLRGMGFRPASLAEFQDTRFFGMRLKNAMEDWRRSIYTRYRNALLRGEDISDILPLIDDFNTTAIEYGGKISGLSLITGESLRRALKPATERYSTLVGRM